MLRRRVVARHYDEIAGECGAGALLRLMLRLHADALPASTPGHSVPSRAHDATSAGQFYTYDNYSRHSNFDCFIADYLAVRELTRVDFGRASAAALSMPKQL